MEPPFYELAEAWIHLQPIVELAGLDQVHGSTADKIFTRSAKSLHAYHARCPALDEEDPLAYSVRMWFTKLWYSTTPQFQAENASLRRTIPAPPKSMIDQLSYYDIRNPRLSNDGLLGPLDRDAWPVRPPSTPAIPPATSKRAQEITSDVVSARLSPALNRISLNPRTVEEPFPLASTSGPGAPPLPGLAPENDIEPMDNEKGGVTRMVQTRTRSKKGASGKAKPKSGPSKMKAPSGVLAEHGDTIVVNHNKLKGRAQSADVEREAENNTDTTIHDEADGDASILSPYHARLRHAGGFQKPQISCLACHIRGELCETSANGVDPLMGPCGACRARKVGCTFSKGTAQRSQERDGAHNFGQGGMAGLGRWKENLKRLHTQHLLLLASANNALWAMKKDCEYIKSQMHIRLAELGPVELCKLFIGRPPTPAESKMTSEDLICNLVGLQIGLPPDIIDYIGSAEIHEGLRSPSTISSLVALSENGDASMPDSAASVKRKRTNAQESPEKHDMDVDPVATQDIPPASTSAAVLGAGTLITTSGSHTNDLAPGARGVIPAKRRRLGSSA